MIKKFITPQAWINGTWAQDVLLEVDAHGHWSRVQPGADAQACVGAQRLAGPVLPGVVNAHSHAFQRAIAGLTERRGAAAQAQGDDFWSWRDQMYRVALRISSAQLEVIATQLYAELLAGGYTQVCEFHYLHNAPNGKPYADPLEMSLALVRAAQQVGIGLTLLPVLYMRSGFGAAGLRDDQRRFASTPESVLAMVQGLQSLARAQAWQHVNVGVALHSLRAADTGAITEVAQEADRMGLPIHIHIAEQTQEVQDCVAHTGQRPIEHLLATQALNARWSLVHATHTTPAELQGVADAGAAIVICPSTEGNLGDGVFDYPGYASRGGVWSVGSDSHVTRGWSEELRLLEYSQRLTLRQRNVAANVQRAGHTTPESSAATIFEATLQGGTRASGLKIGSIAVGNRADMLVQSPQASALLGVPAHALLDAQVFSSPDAPFSQVYVAGMLRAGGQSPALARDALAQKYAATLRALLG